MELKDFIKTTLVEIALGVRGANEKLSSINNGTGELYKLRRNTSKSDVASNIEYDVALTVSEDQADKAGFFVALASIGASANTEKSTNIGNTHRVKFEINVSENWR